MVNVVGLFDTEGQAQQTVRELTNAGFANSELSVVARDKAAAYRVRTDDDHATMTGEMAFKGAEGGAVVGGIIGLLAGLGAIALPGLGLLIAGPLAGLALGAATGAVAGGVLGALIGLGIPEDEAHVYAESIRRGSIMVTVHCDDSRADVAEEIMERNGAVDVDERKERYHEEGFTRYDENAAVVEEEVVTHSPAGPSKVRRYITEAAGPREVLMAGGSLNGDADEVYRTHYATAYQPAGIAYEEMLPAYQYGYQVALNPAWHNRDWLAVEEMARPEWEARYAGTWDQRKDAIRAGFEAARARSSGRATLM